MKLFNDRKYDRLRRGHRPGHGRGTRLEDLPMRKIVIERISGRKKDSPPFPVPSAVAAIPEPMPA